MITAVPVEPLGFRIGTFFILYPIVQIYFIQRIIPFEYWIILYHLLRTCPTVRKLPKSFRRICISLHMFDILTSFEHYHFQPLLGQFLGRPATADPGANYNSIIYIVSHKYSFVDMNNAYLP